MRRTGANYQRVSYLLKRGVSVCRHVTFVPAVHGLLSAFRLGGGLLRLVVRVHHRHTDRELHRNPSEEQLLRGVGGIFDGTDAAFDRTVRGVHHDFVVEEEDELTGNRTVGTQASQPAS